MSLLKKAVDELYLRCDGAHSLDGAGFSLFDKKFGHYLATAEYSEWSDNQRHSAWKMLRKYKKQLDGYGIDYDSISEPPKPVYEAKKVQSGSIREGRKLYYDSKRKVFLVTFPWPKDKFLVEVIKSTFQGRVYDPTKKWWVLTLNTHNARAAADLISEYAFETDDSTIKVIESRSGGATKTIEKVNNKNELVVDFPFNYQIYKDLKEIPSTVKKGNSYLVKNLDADSASQVYALVGKHDFVISDSAVEYIERLITQAVHNIEESRSEEAELDLPEWVLGTPYPFQVAGIKYAMRNKKVIIGDEMGLGKTNQALLSAVLDGADKILIACPTSVTLNWATEIYNWFGDKWTATVIEGRKATKRGDHTVLTWHGVKRVPINNLRCKFVICGYSVLSSHKAWFGNKFDTVIYDESHYLKNPKTKRTKAALVYANKAKRVFLLTGTAIKNRPVELVPQLKIIGKLPAFGGANGFKMRYCAPKYNGFGYTYDGASNMEELNRKLRSAGFIRRMVKDVLKELPPVQTSIVPLEIDNESEYKRADDDPITYIYNEALNDKELWKEVMGLLRDSGYKNTTPETLIKTLAQEKADRATRAEHLVRICVLRRVAAKGKMKSVVEWVNDFLDGSEEKVVLFAVHRDIQARLVQEFPGCAHVLGSDSALVRQEQVDRFQNDPDCRVIVCSLYAASEGITLHAASNVAFIQEGWEPATRKQAIARVHRIGQESQSVNAWFLEASDTIEIDIAALINKKQDRLDKTLDGDLSAEEDYVSTLKQLIGGMENDNGL